MAEAIITLFILAGLFIALSSVAVVSRGRRQRLRAGRGRNGSRNSWWAGGAAGSSGHGSSSSSGSGTSCGSSTSCGGSSSCGGGSSSCGGGGGCGGGS